jgi:hypothetical protein
MAKKITKKTQEIQKKAEEELQKNQANLTENSEQNPGPTIDTPDARPAVITTVTIDDPPAAKEKKSEPKKEVKNKKKEVGIDENEEVAAENLTPTCPTCKRKINSKTFVFPGVNRQSINGIHNGIPYQIVESKRVKCNFCGQIFFVKNYL